VLSYEKCLSGEEKRGLERRRSLSGLEEAGGELRQVYVKTLPPNAKEGRLGNDKGKKFVKPFFSQSTIYRGGTENGQPADDEGAHAAVELESLTGPLSKKKSSRQGGRPTKWPGSGTQTKRWEGRRPGLGGVWVHPITRERIGRLSTYRRNSSSFAASKLLGGGRGGLGGFNSFIIRRKKRRGGMYTSI